MSTAQSPYEHSTNVTIASTSQACTKSTPTSSAVQQGVNAMAGTYARFQPRAAGFQEEIGESVEQVLQASMFTHSTLTEGEWVQVHHAGSLHDLKVLALKPEAAVSIIGTLLQLCQVSHNVQSITEILRCIIMAMLSCSSFSFLNVLLYLGQTLATSFCFTSLAA